MISFVLIIFLIACGSCEILAHEGHPKNVILVIANGMSATAVTAARVEEAIRLQNSSHLLSFETFPHRGALKTYDSEMKFGSGISGSLALLHGTHNLNSHSCNETQTLLSSAQLWKKSSGLVTTMQLTDMIPATLYGHGNEFSAGVCPEISAERNCSDASCLLIHGFSGKKMDVVIGKTTHEVEDSGLRSGQKPFITEWLEKESNRTYVNSTEQFKELKFEQGRQVLGLFSENDLMKNHFDEEHGGHKLKNVVNKAINMLSENPNGFLLVVIVGLDDVIKTIGLVSELSSSIWEATSRKDTLLVITSDLAHNLNNCTVEKAGNVMPRKERSMTDEEVPTNIYNVELPILTLNTTSSLTSSKNNSDDVIKATSKNHSDDNNGRVICEKDGGHNFLDVPVYASGPYPGKFPAVQDQASFGKKMMELMDEGHMQYIVPKETYNEFEISTSNQKLDSDMFQRDIKAAMAQIDEMAKEIFKGWA